MIETKLKETLIHLHDGIKVADGNSVSTALNEIESMLCQYRSELDPRLVHFLEGRSYAKALAYLGGGESGMGRPSSPPGGCGGKS